LIQLYTDMSPHAWKVPIALEEMGLPYEVNHISIGAGAQKSPDYLKISPWGVVPTIVDQDVDDLVVIESGAILIYLAEKTGRLLPTEMKARSTVLQWLMFQMGGIGPMQGQANVFFRYAPERIPYAIGRYQKETMRLYGVLEKQLAGREYLVDDYSIADIANWSWVSIHGWAGVETDDLPHLTRWKDAIKDRPAVQRGRAVPAVPEPSESDAGDVAEQGKKILI